MAVSLVKAHTGSTAKAAGTTLDVTLTSDVPAGNVLVVTFGHNNSSATTPTVSGVPTGFTNLVDVSAISATGNAAAKQSVAMSDGRAFTSGTVLTFTLSASRTARAAVITEWSGADPALTVVGSPSVSETTASPTSPSGFATGDLLVASFVSETNADIAAATSGWAIASGRATSGSTAGTNISVSTQYKNTDSNPSVSVIDGSGVVLLLKEASVLEDEFYIWDGSALGTSVRVDPFVWDGSALAPLDVFATT